MRPILKPPIPVAFRWLVCAALLAFAARLVFGFETDELAHLRIAWSIGNGLVPYRDFYDGHPPLYHLLLAPLFHGLEGSPIPLLVPLRLLALGISLAMLGLFWRFVWQGFGGQVALGAVFTLVLLDPWGTRGIELRPDWLALALGLGGALLMIAPDHSNQPAKFWRFGLAGLAAGLAICATQKALVPAAGCFAWQAGTVLFAEGGEPRRSRTLGLAIWLFGTAVPLTGLGHALAQLGVLETMLHTVLIAPMSFRAVHHWGYPLQEGTIAHLGLYAAGLAGLFRTFATLRTELRLASARSLSAVLGAVGILSLLRTSDPSRQWLLFAVLPWLSVLAAAEIERLAGAGVLEAGDRRRWLFALAMPLLGLKWFNAAAAAVVWSPLLMLAVRALNPQAEPGARSKRLWQIGLATAALMFVGRSAESFLGFGVAAQSRQMEALNAIAGPTSGVLQIWPTVLPFRADPAYHWYICSPMAENLPFGQIEQEYLGLLRNGQVRLVLGNEEDLGERLPLVRLELNSETWARATFPASRYDLAAWQRVRTATGPPPTSPEAAPRPSRTSPPSRREGEGNGAPDLPPRSK